MREAKPQPTDAAPFPSKMPRLISDKESHAWGLEEVAKKIPKGRAIMIIGTKETES